MIYLLWLGSPILVFVALLLLDRKVSSNFTEFLRFCKFIINNDILVLSVTFVLLLLNEEALGRRFPSCSAADPITGFVALSVLVTVGHIIGYIRYKRFTKDLESHSGTPKKLPLVSSILSSVKLFLVIFIFGFVLLASFYPDSKTNPTIVLWCLAAISAFLAIFIHVRMQITNTTISSMIKSTLTKYFWI